MRFDAVLVGLCSAAAWGCALTALNNIESPWLLAVSITLAALRAAADGTLTNGELDRMIDRLQAIEVKTRNTRDALWRRKNNVVPLSA